MPRAVVESLAVRGLVPRGLGGAAAERLRRAVDGPLQGCLAEAFGVLDDLDPGAYWVLRELAVQVSVPASDPDPGRQARRIADGLAAAVELVVRRGPSADAIRFVSRADYVAAFVRARTAASGLGWVFARLRSFDVLSAGDALLAAARAVETDVLEVIAVLAGPGGGWERLVLGLSPAEAGRVAAALVRSVGGASPNADAVAHVAGIRASWTATGRWVPALRRGRDAVRLLLLGELAAAGPLTPALVAALWRDASETSASGTPNADGPASASARTTPRPGPADGWVAPPSMGPGWDAEPAGPLSFATPGAVAFLLLPDLEVLLAPAPELAAAGPAAALVRAGILAGVFGGALDRGDPALALAAGGWAAGNEPDPGELAALVAGPLATLGAAVADDPVLGFVHEADAGRFGRDPLPVVANALLRSFARHLHGFGRASAAHLVPRTLPLGGRVTVTDELIEAVLPRPQLEVLLALAGLDAFACRPAWLAARVLVSHEVGP